MTANAPDNDPNAPDNDPTGPDNDPTGPARGDPGDGGAGEKDEGPLESRPQIDVRFSYANERTFLAWNRTALALVTAGLAITQLLPPFDVPGGRKMIGMPLIILGIVLAIASLRQWRKNEEAMHKGEPLPASPLPMIVAVVIGLSAVIAGILAAFGGSA